VNSRVEEKQKQQLKKSQQKLQAHPNDEALSQREQAKGFLQREEQ
jgi:hypothetical protein